MDFVETCIQAVLIELRDAHEAANVASTNE
jgi:hypothetical protein